MKRNWECSTNRLAWTDLYLLSSSYRKIVNNSHNYKPYMQCIFYVECCVCQLRKPNLFIWLSLGAIWFQLILALSPIPWVRKAWVTALMIKVFFPHKLIASIGRHQVCTYQSSGMFYHTLAESGWCKFLCTYVRSC